MYTKADHDRIHDAILAAEQRTSGEIFCIAAQESGKYPEVSFAWAALVTLLAPPAALLLGVQPTILATAVERLENNGWTAGHVGALSASLIGYALMQIVLFAVAFMLFSIPAIRRLLTPNRLKTSHVHAKAMEQFAHRLHSTSGRTGVLIFASLAERRVQVIADEDIHAKVGDAAWHKAVQAALDQIKTGDIAGGLIAAVNICGGVLAQHFPPDGTGPAAGDVAEI